MWREKKREDSHEKPTRKEERMKERENGRKENITGRELRKSL